MRPPPLILTHALHFFQSLTASAAVVNVPYVCASRSVASIHPVHAARPLLGQPWSLASLCVTALVRFNPLQSIVGARMRSSTASVSIQKKIDSFEMHCAPLPLSSKPHNHLPTLSLSRLVSLHDSFPCFLWPSSCLPHIPAQTPIDPGRK